MAGSDPKMLFDEKAILDRVDEMAARISRDYAGVDEICLVGVLKGAFIFLSDLARRLSIPRRVDFVALASYGASTTPDAVRLIMDLRESIKDRHVLIVDDIVDTGRTMVYLKKMLEARGPASIRTCALTRKTKEREASPDLDYVGFEIPDVWVVGYGLDHADRYRTLPYIGIYEPPEDDS
jgi:hypoxanthine phosphoribosyltransferase